MIKVNFWSILVNNLGGWGVVLYYLIFWYVIMKFKGKVFFGVKIKYFCEY